ncbi:unnamed protein product [Caenorhabditis nigoni]
MRYFRREYCNTEYHDIIDASDSELLVPRCCPGSLDGNGISKFANCTMLARTCYQELITDLQASTTDDAPRLAHFLNKGFVSCVARVEPNFTPDDVLDKCFRKIFDEIAATEKFSNAVVNEANIELSRFWVPADCGGSPLKCFQELVRSLAESNSPGLPEFAKDLSGGISGCLTILGPFISINV